MPGWRIYFIINARKAQIIMELTHFNSDGRAKMVDVTGKEDSEREAVAQGSIVMSPATVALIKQGAIGKGDVLAVAQVAAIMGAKKTPDIIPMCHPVMLSGVNIDLSINESESAVNIVAKVKTTGKTGVEMEALTAIATAALTIYDMCKAKDKNMIIKDIRLIEKKGGKSGHYIMK